MKQFRKWWEKHRASRGPHTCQSSRGENLAQLADEEIWRACLEWMLSNETSVCYSLPVVLTDIIRKELEE